MTKFSPEKLRGPFYMLSPDEIKAPPLTCSLINALAANLRYVQSIIKDDPELAADLLNDIVPQRYTYNAGEKLEELRQHNETLRELGWYWREVAGQLHKLVQAQASSAPASAPTQLAAHVQQGLDLRWEQFLSEKLS